MIVPRPLHPIHLLSFIAKRAAPELLAQGQLNFYANRETSSMASSLFIDDADRGAAIDDIKNDGRIWIHRPFQITPLSTPATSGGPTITSCPLPKATPYSSPEEKLHYFVSSSPTPEKVLKQIYQSKVELYDSQLQSRVAKEALTRIQRRTIQSPHGLGEVDATIYLPEKDDTQHDAPPKLQGICLHVHGGGWLWGDSYHQVAHRCLEMAKSMNVAVVSVEYSLFCQVNRHCNENNNPDAFDPVSDVSIAIDWIESNGARELNTCPSFVASGESSGAHLLLLAMLNRRDRDKPSSTTQSTTSLTSSWKCLNLVYGVYDISGTPSIRADGDSSSPLCGNDLLWMYDVYYSKVQQSMQVTNDSSAQQMNMDRQHQLLSPLYANLSHMPPALITIGTADPLVDDSLFLANKYSAYGNRVELAIYEGGEHGIGHFGRQEDEEMGIQARRHTLEFMKEYL